MGFCHRPQRIILSNPSQGGFLLYDCTTTTDPPPPQLCEKNPSVRKMCGTSCPGAVAVTAIWPSLPLIPRRDGTGEDGTIKKILPCSPFFLAVALLTLPLSRNERRRRQASSSQKRSHPKHGIHRMWSIITFWMPIIFWRAVIKSD